MAWALACLEIEGLRKSVTRCFFLVVIHHILQLVVLLVKNLFGQKYEAGGVQRSVTSIKS